MAQAPCYVPSPAVAHGSSAANPLTRRSAFCGSAVQHVAVVAAPRARQPARVHMGLFGLGFPEIAVIAGVAALVFGPGKIAELGKDLGGIAGSVKKATVEFQEAMSESLEEADREIEQKKVANAAASKEDPVTIEPAVAEAAKAEEPSSSSSSSA
jgi:TatA/E family protein of Tat protein translocase